MSGWVSPILHQVRSHLGSLRGGNGAERWARRMGARLSTERMALCGGVERRSQGSYGTAADGRTVKFEATASPVRFACENPSERIWINRVTSKFLLVF